MLFPVFIKLRMLSSLKGIKGHTCNTVDKIDSTKPEGSSVFPSLKFVLTVR